MFRPVNHLPSVIIWIFLCACYSGCTAHSDSRNPNSANPDSTQSGNITNPESDENFDHPPGSGWFAQNHFQSAGLIGPLGGPSFNPLSWHKVEGDVLAYTDDVWGRRVKPRGVFQIPGGIGILYNSKPPADYSGNGALYQTGSLAFTRNLVNWYDYPGNPVLSEIQHEWQGRQRVMPRAMLYDGRNEQWVVYFVDALGSYTGTRAVGVAYSRDLKTWEIDERIAMTIEDYASETAHLSNRSVDEIIKQRGRVYAAWAKFHEDRYYISASGYMFVSDEPGGPFEYYDGFRGELSPRTRPVYWAGKWYTAFPGTWDGQPGIGLASSDHLMGPYRENTDNPVFTIESTSRARPQLIRYDGVWAVIYCHTYDGDTNRMSLRVAVSGIHPDIISAIQN